MTHTIHVGDCLEWLRTLPDNSVDSVVTDPPYGLGKEPDAREVLRAWLDGEEYKPGGSGFMGRAWDAFVPSPPVWAECLRVLKPGGHLLAFAGTRTYDWIVMGVRLAGFEVRDLVGWLYGSGFPKSLDVSKAIDAAAGADHLREFKCANPANRPYNHTAGETGTGWKSPPRPDKTHPATEAARQWAGWGTALKPSIEPVVMARKPLSGTVAENVLEWGTGGINVDGCRVGMREERNLNRAGSIGYGGSEPQGIVKDGGIGRWPANIIHDGSPDVLAVFPKAGGRNPQGVKVNTKTPTGSPIGKVTYGGGHTESQTVAYNDTGSAARFYYAAKASRSEREHGLDALPRGIVDPTRAEDSAGRDNPRAGAGRSGSGRANIHPTVKPVDLMRYLLRLVTPPGGLTIDPYAGSGTTGVAAVHEGFRFKGCELETPHALIAVTRIAQAVTDEREERELATMQQTLF